MPFTPFHMGPGCAVKAVLSRHFSLTVFGFAQVAMDLETLVRILRHDTVIHGFSHTYLGAAGIGVISLLLGRPLCQRLLNWWTAGAAGSGSPFVKWLAGPWTISLPAAISGAFIGTFSHVLLDSFMHRDMQPFLPFAEGNDLLYFISIGPLHLYCILAGLLGLAALLGLKSRHRGD
jgi:hypothetical protein